MSNFLKDYSVANDTADGTLKTKLLHTEIGDSGHVVGLTGLQVIDDTISVMGDSIANEAGLDAVVAAHESVPLADYKENKKLGIDANTGVLILQGCLFEGVVFSMSSNAQRNWTALDTVRDELTYPFPVSLKDDSEFIFTDVTHYHTFSMTAMGTANAHYTSGRTLKMQIDSATTKAEVDAVEDTR